MNLPQLSIRRIEYPISNDLCKFPQPFRTYSNKNSFMLPLMGACFRRRDAEYRPSVRSRNVRRRFHLRIFINARGIIHSSRRGREKNIFRRVKSAHTDTQGKEGIRVTRIFVGPGNYENACI